MAKKVGFNADDMKVEDVGDARFNEPMAPKPRELSSEEEASKYMREKRNKARELEIEEVLADYTAKPKPIPPPVKKKKRRGCCYSFRRAMNCCIKVPLHEAVVDGESNMTLRAMQRLNKKAKTKPMVNAYDEWGRTALALAIKEEREDLADLILSLEANPDKPDSTEINETLVDYAPVHLAVQNGAYNTVNKLRWREADMNAVDQNGTSPLMLAAMLGDTAVVQALLDNGADPEATDNMGWTPLIYAAYGGHLAVTEIILDQGVEKREKDHKGYMAYDWAMYMRRRTGEMHYGEVEAYLETFKPRMRFKSGAGKYMDEADA